MKPTNRIIVTLVRVSWFFERNQDAICRCLMAMALLAMLALGYVKDWRCYMYAGLMALVWGAGELIYKGLSQR